VLNSAHISSLGLKEKRFRESWIIVLRNILSSTFRGTFEKGLANRHTKTFFPRFASTFFVAVEHKKTPSLSKLN
jgi:hypothetical protein